MYQDLFTVIAPATLAALIFWSGVLYQRIKDLEKQRVSDKEHNTKCFDDFKGNYELYFKCYRNIETKLNEIKIEFASVSGKLETLEQRIGKKTY